MTRRNKNRSTRRRRRIAPRRNGPSAMPFIQYLGRQLFTTAVGVNTISLQFSTLFSDLNSARLVKVRRITVKFYPNDTAQMFSFQLGFVDPGSLVLVPCTPIKPLSVVNSTVLTATMPTMNWQPAGATTIAVAIILFSTVITNVMYDIQTTALVARDFLS
jgi:hypothetical protein